jgi:hypothetical protein
LAARRGRACSKHNILTAVGCTARACSKHSGLTAVGRTMKVCSKHNSLTAVGCTTKACSKHNSLTAVGHTMKVPPRRRASSILHDDSKGSGGPIHSQQRPGNLLSLCLRSSVRSLASCNTGNSITAGRSRPTGPLTQRRDFKRQSNDISIITRAASVAVESRD